MGFYSWDTRDFIKLFAKPGHREAVTHKYSPQVVVYNSATVSCTLISTAEYIHTKKSWVWERSSVQYFQAFLFRQQGSWPLVEEGAQSEQEAFGTFKAT